ncbi:unnamed protein product [Lymnaea stagnalis]|uniref:G-protein coupled receptors family 1 profile domain-containing protein n=1 Tax=Lymnaea stagnalis TaxID=6523 RepID=A0AAV2I989_LYMST
MLACFSVLGLLGNSLVLYVYVRKRNKLSSTVFIIALAAIDLVTSAIGMPYTMVVEGLNYHISLDFSCKLYYFIITCTVPFSVFIMVAIAIDRYICICRPHSHVLDSTRAKYCVLVLLFMAIVIGAVAAMFHGVYLDVDTLRKKDVRPHPMENMLNKEFKNISDAYKLFADGTCRDCVNTSDTTEDFMYEYLTFLIKLYVKVCNQASPINESYIYTGQCLPNQILFSERFRFTYQTIYSSSFLVCFFVVFVLYILIYRSVLVRRSRRLASRNKSKLTHTMDLSLTENQSMLNDSPDKSIAMTDISNGNKDGQKKLLNPPPTQSLLLKEQRQPQFQIEDGSQKITIPNNGCLKDKYFLANIRTAIMLFVVTIFFIIAYLPSWLIAHKVIRFNVIVFYVYFSNHIVNPIIYAFMNPAFRRSLKALVCRKPGRAL